MSKLPTLRRKPPGVKKARAKLFEFEPSLAEYLEKQSAKENKTMVAFLEELLRIRRSSKTTISNP